MLKNILLISTLSSLTLALTACNGSDDSSSNTDVKVIDTKEEDCGCSDNQVVFAEIVKTNNSATNTNYLSRTNVILQTGQPVQQTKTAILGEMPSTESEPTYYRLAPNFYSAETYKESSKNTRVQKVDDTTKMFAIDVTGKSNNDEVKKLTSTYSLTSLDISGVNKDSTGFSTVLQRVNLPNSVFPEGSKCNVYAKSAKSFPYLSITIKNKIEEKSIDAWIAKQKSTNIDVTGEVTLAVGANNEHQAVYLTLTDSKKPAPAVIKFYGDLYATTYSSFTESSKNIDPSKAKVQCDSYNNVAADYLEEQVQANLTVADLN